MAAAVDGRSTCGIAVACQNRTESDGAAKEAKAVTAAGTRERVGGPSVKKNARERGAQERNTGVPYVSAVILSWTHLSI